MAVAAAASQHLALRLRASDSPPPFHSRLTHARASLYLLPSPSLSLSPTRPHSHVFRLRSLSLPRSRASSFSPHSRSSVSTCAPHNAFPSRLSPFGVCIFFISLSLSSVHRCPPTSVGEREKDEENGGGPSCFSEPSFLSPLLQVFSGEPEGR